MTTQAVTIAEADKQLTAATETLEKLKAKILDKGPGAVSPEELGDAAHAVEHARLTVQHAAEAAEAEAQRQRHTQLEELKARILDDAGDVDTALDAMHQIEQAAATLITACTGRQKLIGQATAAMRRARVPRHSEGQAEQHAGLAWSDAALGHGDEIHVDDRSITSVNPGLLIAAAIQRAAQQAGSSTGHLAPVLQINGPAIIGDPADWLRQRF